MKNWSSLSYLAAALVCLGFLSSHAEVAAGEHQGHFRHVVCFKFKDGTGEAEIAEIEKAFAGLEEKIDAIIDFEWGTTENIEPLNDEFTHCFLVTFKDRKGLEVYLPHPDHKAFVSLLKPKLDKVFVFDYTVK